MNVDGCPNVRACITPVRDGIHVKHQNAYPSLENDWLSIIGWFDWLMPVGFYYKTFTHPIIWRLVEPIIRKIAGLGEVLSPNSKSTAEDNESYPPSNQEYEHIHQYTDIAIIGGGRAGITAANQAAKSGLEVTLVDDQAELGGKLRYRPEFALTDGGGRGSLLDQVKGIESLPNLHILNNASCFGFYEGNLLAITQKRIQSSKPENGRSEVERTIHLRTKSTIFATGSYEVPLVFENNDLVGIMLSSAVERLVNLHDIKPAERAVIISPEKDGGSVAKDLQRVGVQINAIVPPESVIAAAGRKRVTSIVTKENKISCDLIVVCGARVPEVGLITQAGGELKWDGERAAFVPTNLPPSVFVAGEVTGIYDHEVALVQGSNAAIEAVRDLGVESGEENGETPRPNNVSPPSVVYHPSSELRGKSFVCFCEDVTVKDLHNAIDEGFDHIETLKRYTTVTMGPCQGKMCQLASISVCGHKTDKPSADVGTTTARPPNPSVSLGALAGARHHPVKHTPMHYQHDELGCIWMDMGEWKRPLYYKNHDLEDEKGCIEEEYRAVREGVGIIDLSTLGKLEVKGVDAAKLLDKVYTNRLSDLRVGRARYSIICDDAGIILDDGTISRLGDDHFFITTTTGNIEFVQEWLEWWMVGTGWCVHITNVTSGLAAVNVAGPLAREMLVGKDEHSLVDCDLATKAFPYMACRQTEVGGVPCLMLRLGFVGETGWEIHFPAEYGEYLWELLMAAGEDLGIKPFGVEAQRLLRLEKKHTIVGVDTDATSSPLGAELAWAVKLEKEDFIGKAAILRLGKGETREKLVGFVMIEDNVIPQDGAAIVLEGRPVGRVTSARFSPVNGRAVGMAWLAADFTEKDSEIQVNVNGRLEKARIASESFYDPKGKRLRM